ncbi:MAG: alpha/beta hydrolase [Bacteroidota bacterium]
MKRLLLQFALLAIGAFYCPQAQAQELHLYKEIDTLKLYVEVYAPSTMTDSAELPAMVFFFGGGWKSGTREHFIHHAKYFAQRGIVCFLADYRIQNKHQTDPFTSLMDAKSALRFIRSHAQEFKIDPDKIIASGGSAGGHLAAATALIKAYDAPSDDLAVSCVPNALVLFNPVIDNGPGGYGFERVGEAFPNFSPLHNIREGAPPTIIFLGTNDRLIPVETAEYYTKVMERVGSRCELKLYEEGKHGFFNYQFFEHYQATVEEADLFLQSLGYLQAEPAVEIK